MKTNKRSSRNGGAGVGYPYTNCVGCKDPLSNSKIYCLECVKNAMKELSKPFYGKK